MIGKIAIIMIIIITSLNEEEEEEEETEAAVVGDGHHSIDIMLNQVRLQVCTKRD